MKTATVIADTLLRITGAIQIVLGLLFWTGNALNLIPLHILSGLVLVLSLWVLAILAALAGVNRGFVALAIVWGFIVPILGLTQTQLLPGPAHWVIEVLHLIVGLAAIGMGQGLARRIKQVRTPVLQAS
ncbi:MAG: hypothetical protein L0332_31695 [Chloroflexi bacterium]|nr:hypothetical protein [Chloroflexota bacterium]MCI0575308.1 hypothetical protein [Chloroflexota bacterium]MCI0647630.1 hypothetical protein [Chloroflexota bacterium]MCI0731267.1 hypothetical protein [Chloroflexota bacterium]